MLFKRCFDNLEPGGWLEMQSIEIGTTSDDESHLRAPNFLRVIDLTYSSSEEFGKSVRTVQKWKSLMEKANFINVTEKVMKVCPSPFSLLLYPLPKHHGRLEATFQLKRD
jgi:hypothetical protein